MPRAQRNNSTYLVLCCRAAWEPTIGNGRPHRTIIYFFWAAGGLLSIECLRFPRARGPARVAENSPQTHNRGAWVPCLCPWRRLGVAPAAQGRRLNLFIYLINFMSVETTFNGPRTIRFEILIPTLVSRASSCISPLTPSTYILRGAWAIPNKALEASSRNPRD